MTRSAADEWIIVGRLGSPHGVGGELRFFPETDYPERLVPGRRVAACPADGDPWWTEIASCRALPGRGLALGLTGLASRQAATAFAGGTLCVRAVDLPPLPAGRFYHHQLVGLAVLGPDGAEVGRVAAVRQTGANDVFVVARPGRPEALIPAVRDAVAEIDLAGGRIVLRPLAGLLDG